MEITYANRRIQKACANLDAMRKAYGDRRALTLATRLDQLQQAANLEQLRNVAGDWHELKQNRRGQIASNVGHPYRLTLVPTDDPPPTKPDGGLDWTRITAVTILEVVDYH